ncbi:MAG: FixH family protein [Deltaproteobacteria bacterium]|nr:FixH family protein [Deltaproteobacteria bacterium]
MSPLGVRVLAAALLASAASGCGRERPPQAPQPAPEPAVAAPDAAPAQPAAAPAPRFETEQLSRGGLYRVQVRSQVLPIPLRQPHEWVAHITTPEGQPVTPERVLVDGGMPAHGHGFPTRPRAERQLGGGDLLIEGVEFNMEGRWELTLAIVGPAGRDIVTFTFDLRDAAGGERPPEQADRQLLASLSLAALGPPPADPSNRMADDPRAVALGERLFHDPGLSRGGATACVACHQPALAFTDGRALAHGTGDAERNTPSLLGAGWHRWLTWDGRRDSLWSQALAPLESPVEMGGTRLEVVRYVLQHPEHGPAFAALFGPAPDALLAPDLPARAGPFGEPAERDAWMALAPATREATDRAFASIGKVLGAFQRTLRPTGSRFDRYVATALGRGEAAAAPILSPDERAGLALFVDPARTHCLRCHNGPLFTNEGFHNVATGSTEPPRYDLGRAVGIQAAIIDPFNCTGPHSDAPAEACRHLLLLDPRHAGGTLRGAFKVPTLRNVARTAPYMHDGRFATLEEVMDHYREPPPPDAARHELPTLDLTDRESEQIVAFLRALTDEPGSEAHPPPAH